MQGFRILNVYIRQKAELAEWIEQRDTEWFINNGNKMKEKGV